jgi:hypothetical protein
MGDELRMAAAVKLFELGRLSAGAAAELAGVPNPLFLVRLADYGVATFRHSEDDLRRDLAGGHEDHFVQREVVRDLAGGNQVAVMDGIERAAHHADPARRERGSGHG